MVVTKKQSCIDALWLGYEQFQRDAEASINSLKVSQGDELRALQVGRYEHGNKIAIFVLVRFKGVE